MNADWKWLKLAVEPPHDRGFLAYSRAFVGHTGTARWSEGAHAFVTNDGKIIDILWWVPLPVDPESTSSMGRPDDDR